jgi:hypothetical protein
MLTATMGRFPPPPVTVEVAIADKSAEPIHLQLDGRSACKLTPEAAERLADNLREAARQARGGVA